MRPYRAPMSSLHLIRSLRHALAALRDAQGAEATTRVARALIAELEAEIEADGMERRVLVTPPDVWSWSAARVFDVAPGPDLAVQA